ncbi:MAG: hypothetical protein LBK99_27510 [Opitutaceae bacterium]|nr:hypothetical protein [Opitutaceae bacterium]
MNGSFDADYYGSLLVSARIACRKWFFISLVSMGIVVGIFTVTLPGVAEGEARSAGFFAGAMACVLTVCPLAFCLAAVGDVINASRELKRIASKKTGENDTAAVTVFPLQTSRAGTPSDASAIISRTATMETAATESAAEAKMVAASASGEVSAVVEVNGLATPAAPHISSTSLSPPSSSSLLSLFPLLLRLFRIASLELRN